MQNANYRSYNDKGNMIMHKITTKTLYKHYINNVNVRNSGTYVNDFNLGPVYMVSVTRDSPPPRQLY